MGYNPQIVIDLSKPERGYLEKKKNCPRIKLYDKKAYAGSDNWTKYWQDLADWKLGNYQGSYWCAAYLTWLYIKAYGIEGARKLLFKLPYISCQNCYDLFKSKEKALGKQLVFDTPKAGDIVVFWNGSRMHHTELVISVNGDTYKTDGGNTAANSDVPNGGGVYGPKVYSISAAKKAGHKFLRPLYNYMEAKWIQEGDKWRYDLGNGEYVRSKWYQIKGIWYAFDGAGYMITGWFKDNDSWYFLNYDGAMASGWVKDNGKWYFMDGSGEMHTGWLFDKNVWYYLEEDGSMVVGEKEINGYKYRFKDNGVMYCNEWCLDDKDWYYYGSTGAAYTDSWIQNTDGRWYYLGSDGIMVRDAYIPAATDDKLLYYLDGSGVWDPEKSKRV